MTRLTFEVDRKLHAKAKKYLPYGIISSVLREALEKRVALAEAANKRGS